MAELSEDQKQSRKEIYIPISLKGLTKGLQKIFYKFPVDVYKGAMRKVDDASIHPRMRTGVSAVLTMPLGIMGRNGSRAAHHLADGKYGHVAAIGGIAGAGGAWWLAGTALFGVLTTSVPFLGSVGGTILTAAVAGALTAPVVIPAFTVGLLALATTVGLGITGLSAIPAVVNIKTGLLRTIDRLKGVKYDDAALEQKEEELRDENALSAKYERKAYYEVSSRLQYLSEDGQRRVFESLKGKFDKAVAPKEEAATAAAPAAKPAPAPKR